MASTSRMAASIVAGPSHYSEIAGAKSGGPAPCAPSAPKLADQVMEAALRHGVTVASAGEMTEWYRRFVLFHGKRHPREMGLIEIGQFLQHVAVTEKNPLRMIEAGRISCTSRYCKCGWVSCHGRSRLDFWIKCDKCFA